MWARDGFNFYIIKIGVCFIYLRNDLVALLLCDNFFTYNICKMNSLYTICFVMPFFLQ